MPDRPRPYARTIAVLRVLSWPYRFPPLSWMVALIDWVVASNRRFAVAMVMSLTFVVGAVAWEVFRG